MYQTNSQEILFDKLRVSIGIPARFLNTIMTPKAIKRWWSRVKNQTPETIAAMPKAQRLLRYYMNGYIKYVKHNYIPRPVPQKYQA